MPIGLKNKWLQGSGFDSNSSFYCRKDENEPKRGRERYELFVFKIDEPTLKLHLGT